MYLAGAESFTGLLKDIPEAQNLLISYYVLRKGSRQNKVFKTLSGKDIFVDSGAFSAHTLKIKIDIDKYIEFIKKHEKKISVYCGLDVIGDAGLTFLNNLYMEKHNLKPLVTFHFSEDFRYLQEYIERYDYIALGGVAQLKGDRKKLNRWLETCFHYISKKKGLKVHGFAIFTPKLLLRYPFYSVDASSWLIGSSLGNLMLPRKDHFKIVHCSDKKGLMKHAKEIQKVYPNILDLIDEKGDNVHKLKYKNRLTYNAIAVNKFASYCTEVWEKRGVVWKD